MTDQPKARESELLPCPFCGDDDLEIEAGCYIRCKACCADGPVYEYDDGADDPEAKIAALWNTRPALPVGDVEGVREALDDLLASCGARGRYHALEYADAIEKAEAVLASLPRCGGEGE